MKVAEHQGQALLKRLLKTVNRKPVGVSIGATIRLLAIMIETHQHSGKAVNVEAVHDELDALLASFRLIRLGGGGEA